MSYEPTTLLDLMIMLPCLHPRHLSLTQVMSLKQLRLVSKEVGLLAMSAVTGCNVLLGSATNSFKTQRLSRLMAGTELNRLQVIVTVSSGSNATPHSQQLSTCIHQMELVLEEMGNAMRNVKLLKLVVKHKLDTICINLNALLAKLGVHDSYEKTDRRFPVDNMQIGLEEQKQDMQHTQQLQQKQQAKVINTTCPKSHGSVAGTVFAMLAAAVPDLCKLCLQGSCWDAALQSFGRSCPQLISIEFTIPEVPIEALHEFGLHLPNLVSISITGCSAQDTEAPHISAFLDSFVPMTAHCSHLTSLEIDLEQDIMLECKPDSWELVPSSLQHFRCTCSEDNDDETMMSHSYVDLIRRVQSLSLCVLPDYNLVGLLQACPILKKLEVVETGYPYGTVTLICGEDLETEVSSGGSFLKQRFLQGGFSLSCPHISFSGSNGEMQEVFEWIPCLPSVKDLQLGFEGRSPPLCLGQVHRLFPEVSDLYLTGTDIDEDYDQEPVWDVKMLLPLASLVTNFTLWLKCPQLRFTPSQLADLCSTLHACREVTLDAQMYSGATVTDLKEEFKRMGLSTRASFGKR